MKYRTVFPRRCRAQQRPFARQLCRRYALFCKTADIRQHLGAQPFIPFTVHAADGRERRIPTPERAHVYPSGGRVSIYTDNDKEFILPALLLSGLAFDGVQATRPA